MGYFFIYISADDKGAVLDVSSNWYLNIKKIKIFNVNKEAEDRARNTRIKKGPMSL
jgi:hypothetical protein